MIAIQSMVKAKTSDIRKTVSQIRQLEAVGCEIVRLAVKDEADAKSLGKIKRQIKLPVVADIHFNWKLALAAIENGADKIRLNPGNIYKIAQIREIVREAKLAKIPIRVGVNSGSIRSPQVLRSPGESIQADKMVKSTLDYLKILEGFKFDNIVVSLKASNILDTIEAYRKMSKLCDYPMHLGVTATGMPYSGTVKSSIAIGTLLVGGIGDTIRVSLTQEPQEEIRAAKAILESLGLRRFGPEIISCPTCGRCEVDLVRVVRELEEKLHTKRYASFFSAGSLDNRRPFKIAVMGCIVNGPGEAKEADLGIAFGRKEGLLFRKGKAVKKIPFLNCTQLLLQEMEKLDA